MATRLIRLDDGTLVEVDAEPNQPQHVSSRFADEVSGKLDAMQSLLVQACEPVVKAWRELNQEMELETAQVELGLSFEGEGNLYITKAKAGANIVVTLTLKPPQQ